MNTQQFTEWLTTMPVREKIRALASVYSGLTTSTRAFFLPDATNGREQAALKMLQGVNEIHHTISNWLVDYAVDESKAFPVETLSLQLSQIASYYHLEKWLTSTLERVREA